MAHVLVIDDEPRLGRLLQTIVRERGHSCDWSGSGPDGLCQLSSHPADAVLLDRQMNGMDGFETLRQIHSRVPDLPVLMMTAFGNIEAAVLAMRLGAVDFIEKPFDNDKLLGALETALQKSRPAGGDDAGAALVGESACFRATLDLARRFATPNINVLLVGETGTGKDMLAHTIHAASKRRERPFVPVDCSTLPENLIESELFGHEKGAFTGATASRVGRLELAQGGTLFLDEIGNLPYAMQPKLLRVLQSRRLTRVGGREAIRLDVRLIAATNGNLTEAIARGTFRQDLYYRLAEVTIDVPPLRERSGDIERIAEFYVRFYAQRFARPAKGLSSAAVDLLDAYPWPGNVRELENVMKRAVILAREVVGPDDLPPELRAGPTPVDHGRLHVDLRLDLKAVGQLAAEKAERAFLVATLEQSSFSAGHLARALGVDPKTLRAKLKKYGLAADAQA